MKIVSTDSENFIEEEARKYFNGSNFMNGYLSFGQAYISKAAKAVTHASFTPQFA